MRNFEEVCDEYNWIVPQLKQEEQSEVIRIAVDEIRRQERLGVDHQTSRNLGFEHGIAETKRRLAVRGLMAGAEDYDEIMAAQEIMNG